jgi:serine acetyltransferase
MGNYNVVMPSVNISGAVKIGDCNFFGVQSVVLQCLKIGNDTRIGANSVIIRNTKDGNLYMGNPATKIKF